MTKTIRAASAPGAPHRASAAATGRCPKCHRDFEGCTCGTENPNRPNRARQHLNEVRL